MNLLKRPKIKPRKVHYGGHYFLGQTHVAMGSLCGNDAYSTECTWDREKVTCGRCKQTKAFKEEISR